MPAMTAQDLSSAAEAKYNAAHALVSKEDYTAEDETQAETLLKEGQQLEARAAAFARIDFARQKSQESQGRLTKELDPLSDPNNRLTHMGRPFKYSLIKAINESAHGPDKITGLEMECSKELALKSGKDPRGFYWPHNDLCPRRMSAAQQMAAAPRGTVEQYAVLDSTTTGVGAVQIQVMDEVIVALRAKILADRLGVDVQSGLVGQIRFPKQSSLSSWFWVPEGGEVGDATPAIANQITLVPKTVGNQASIGRKFLLLTDVAEGWVKNELLNGVARALDNALLQGNPANPSPTQVNNSTTPLGISYYPLASEGVSGITPVFFGNGTDEGGPLSWKGVVEMETNVAQANALDLGAPESYSYVATPSTRGLGKTKTKIPSSQYSNFIWESNNEINGYKAIATTQALSNITIGGTGGATGLTSLIFGHFPSIMMGFWTGIDVIVDHITQAKSGMVLITCLQDADLECRYFEAFSISHDIDPLQ